MLLVPVHPHKRLRLRPVIPVLSRVRRRGETQNGAVSSGGVPCQVEEVHEMDYAYNSARLCAH